MVLTFNFGRSLSMSSYTVRHSNCVSTCVTSVPPPSGIESSMTCLSSYSLNQTEECVRFCFFSHSKNASQEASILCYSRWQRCGLLRWIISLGQFKPFKRARRSVPVPTRQHSKLFAINQHPETLLFC